VPIKRICILDLCSSAKELPGPVGIGERESLIASHAVDSERQELARIPGIREWHKRQGASRLGAQGS